MVVLAGTPGPNQRYGTCHGFGANDTGPRAKRAAECSGTEPSPIGMSASPATPIPRTRAERDPEPLPCEALQNGFLLERAQRGRHDDGLATLIGPVPRDLCPWHRPGARVPARGSVCDTQARNSGVCGYFFVAFLAAAVFDVVALAGVFLAAAFFAVVVVTLSATSCLNVAPTLNPTVRVAASCSGAPVEGVAGGARAALTPLKCSEAGELNFVPGRHCAPHLGQGGTEGGLDLRARQAGRGSHGVDQLSTVHQFGARVATAQDRALSLAARCGASAGSLKLSAS